MHGLTTHLLTNERAVPVTFCLEPWGELYPMPPGATFRLEVSGPAADIDVQVDEANDSMTVWVASGGTVRVFDDDTELGASRGGRPAVPPVPPGMSVRDFMEFMFGKGG